MVDIGRLDECTRVMKELEAMLGVSLQAVKEAANPGINRQRNARWLIVNEVLPCLALYPLDAPIGLPGQRVICSEGGRWELLIAGIDV